MGQLTVFPYKAKPHESAILLAYSLGYTDSQSIADLLHYTSPRPVQKVLRTYRDILPSLRIASHKTRVIGNNTIYDPR